jgi:hypothetical protein
MSSKAANPIMRSAAWRISLWATLAFAIGTMLVECPAFSEPVSMRETLSQGAGYGTKEEVHP